MKEQETDELLINNCLFQLPKGSNINISDNLMIILFAVVAACSTRYGLIFCR